jgi:hypothetical protein
MFRIRLSRLTPRKKRKNKIFAGSGRDRTLHNNTIVFYVETPNSGVFFFIQMIQLMYRN